MAFAGLFAKSFAAGGGKLPVGTPNMACKIAISFAMMAGLFGGNMGRASAADDPRDVTISPPDCQPAEGLSFFCDAINAEDLVLLPGGRWIINGQYQGSSTAGGLGPLRLIDTQTSSWRPMHPTMRPVKRRVSKRDPIGSAVRTCNAPANFQTMAAHGIGLQRPRVGPPMIYVVNHDVIERIEIFELHDKLAGPGLAWRGCVKAPKDIHFNSVAVGPDGTIFATALRLPGQVVQGIREGAEVGAIYRLSPDGSEFEKLPLSLSGPNGIEISRDGRTIYVAEMGRKRIVGISLADLSTIGAANLSVFWPDNVHWDEKGRLITAGMNRNRFVAGGAGGTCPTGADPDPYSARPCERTYFVAAIDPETFSHSIIATGSDQDAFSNVSSAMVANGTVWIGSYRSDRLAYRPIDR